jgi:hypothetical protein
VEKKKTLKNLLRQKGKGLIEIIPANNGAEKMRKKNSAAFLKKYSFNKPNVFF